MLQRTNAEQVVPIFKCFEKKFKDPHSFLIHAKRTKTNYFSNLGLSWRNKYLIRAASFIDEYGLPLEKRELLRIPGIGDYAASAFLSLHYNKRCSLIDSNIIRLYSRYFGFYYDGETRRKKWFLDLADRMTPRKSIKSFNYALLDFSRTICKPKPLCDECTLRKRCSFIRSFG